MHVEDECVHVCGDGKVSVRNGGGEEWRGCEGECVHVCGDERVSVGMGGCVGGVRMSVEM